MPPRTEADYDEAYRSHHDRRRQFLDGGARCRGRHTGQRPVVWHLYRQAGAAALLRVPRPSGLGARLLALASWPSGLGRRPLAGWSAAGRLLEAKSLAAAARLEPWLGQGPRLGEVSEYGGALRRPAFFPLLSFPRGRPIMLACAPIDLAFPSPLPHPLPKTGRSTCRGSLHTHDSRWPMAATASRRSARQARALHLD